MARKYNNTTTHRLNSVLNSGRNAGGESNALGGRQCGGNIPRCYNCHQRGHVFQDCPKPKMTICYNCHREGHKTFQCSIGKRCHICDEACHIARNCSLSKGGEKINKPGNTPEGCIGNERVTAEEHILAPGSAAGPGKVLDEGPPALFGKESAFPLENSTCNDGCSSDSLFSKIGLEENQSSYYHRYNQDGKQPGEFMLWRTRNISDKDEENLSLAIESTLGSSFYPNGDISQQPFLCKSCTWCKNGLRCFCNCASCVVHVPQQSSNPAQRSTYSLGSPTITSTLLSFPTILGSVNTNNTLSRSFDPIISQTRRQIDQPVETLLHIFDSACAVSSSSTLVPNADKNEDPTTVHGKKTVVESTDLLQLSNETNKQFVNKGLYSCAQQLRAQSELTTKNIKTQLGNCDIGKSNLSVEPFLKQEGYYRRVDEKPLREQQLNCSSTFSQYKVQSCVSNGSSAQQPFTATHAARGATKCAANHVNSIGVTSDKRKNNENNEINEVQHVEIFETNDKKFCKAKYENSILSQQNVKEASIKGCNTDRIHGENIKSGKCETENVKNENLKQVSLEDGNAIGENAGSDNNGYINRTGEDGLHENKDNEKDGCRYKNFENDIEESKGRGSESHGNEDLRNNDLKNENFTNEDIRDGHSRNEDQGNEGRGCVVDQNVQYAEKSSSARKYCAKYEINDNENKQECIFSSSNFLKNCKETPALREAVNFPGFHPLNAVTTLKQPKVPLSNISSALSSVSFFQNDSFLGSPRSRTCTPFSFQNNCFFTSIPEASEDSNSHPDLDGHCSKKNGSCSPIDAPLPSYHCASTQTGNSWIANPFQPRCLTNDFCSDQARCYQTYNYLEKYKKCAFLLHNHCRQYHSHCSPQKPVTDYTTNAGKSNSSASGCVQSCNDDNNTSADVSQAGCAQFKKVFSPYHLCSQYSNICCSKGDVISPQLKHSNCSDLDPSIEPHINPWNFYTANVFHHHHLVPLQQLVLVCCENPVTETQQVTFASEQNPSDPSFSTHGSCPLLSAPSDSSSSHPSSAHPSANPSSTRPSANPSSTRSSANPSSTHPSTPAHTSVLHTSHPSSHVSSHPSSQVCSSHPPSSSSASSSLLSSFSSCPSFSVSSSHASSSHSYSSSTSFSRLSSSSVHPVSFSSISCTTSPSTCPIPRNCSISPAATSNLPLSSLLCPSTTFPPSSTSSSFLNGCIQNENTSLLSCVVKDSPYFHLSSAVAHDLSSVAVFDNDNNTYCHPRRTTPPIGGYRSLVKEIAARIKPSMPTTQLMIHPSSKLKLKREVTESLSLLQSAATRVLTAKTANALIQTCTVALDEISSCDESHPTQEQSLTT